MTLEDIDNNYWEVYPQAKAAGPYKKLYTSDKTRGKSNSSKIAWCIRLIWDRSSEYFNLEEDEKINLIFNDVMGSPYHETHESLITELTEFYIKTNTTAAKRTLTGIEEKLIERDRFIKRTPYELGELTERGYVGGTVDTLDKMMANTYKLYELYNKARVLVDQEDQSSNKGDIKDSLSDRGDI
jgi:hypothetical protein